MRKITSLFVLCLSFLTLQPGYSIEKPPNIVIILADDEEYIKIIEEMKVLFNEKGK